MSKATSFLDVLVFIGLGILVGKPFLGKEMGNYVTAITTETDDSGPKKPGAINGGFFPKKTGLASAISIHRYRG
jgi:hypothetical protein